MSQRPTDADRRGVGGWALFGGLVIGFSIIVAGQFTPYSFLRGDSAFYITMQRGLLDSGWLEMSAYHPMSWYRGEMPHYAWMDQAWSNLALGADGESYYPKHPYLIALFALPLYALFGPIGSLFFNVLGVSALVCGGYIIARRFCGPSAAILGALPLVLSGLVLENVYTVSNDIFYSALISMGCAAALARRDLVSAILLSCAVVAKPTNILWLPVPFLAILFRAWTENRPLNRRAFALPDAKRLWATARAPLLAVVTIGATAAVLNWIMFGSPFQTSYHSIVIVKGGQVELDSAADAFNQPFWAGLQDQFLNKWQGLWPRGAVLVVAATLGLIGAFRTGPIALTPALALLVYLGLYAKYDFVWARFYLPVATLVPLGLAAPFCQPTLRIGPQWMKSAPALHKAIAGGLGCCVAAIVAGALLALPGTEQNLTDRLTQARVTRSDGQQTFACDYLNPNTMHWECSRLEGAYWKGWGPDVRGECQFDRRADGKPLQGRVDGMWFLHPAPRPVVKRLAFDHLGPLSEMRLLLGYGKNSRGSDARITVTLNDRVVPLPTLRKAVLHSVALSDMVSATTDNRLVIEVQAQRSHDWRHLCVGAEFAVAQ